MKHNMIKHYEEYFREKGRNVPDYIKDYYRPARNIRFRF